MTERVIIFENVDYLKVPEHLKGNKDFGEGDDINSMKG